MRTLPFYQVDVFTDRPFAGNPLAVFPRRRGSRPRRCRRSPARCTSPRRRSCCRPRPAATRGCASSRRRSSCPSPATRAWVRPASWSGSVWSTSTEPVTRVVLELGVGPTAVDVTVRGGVPVAATVHQRPPVFHAPAPRGSVAAVLGLDLERPAPRVRPRPGRHGSLLHDHPAGFAARAGARLPRPRLAGDFERRHAESTRARSPARTSRGWRRAACSRSRASPRTRPPAAPPGRSRPTWRARACCRSTRSAWCSRGRSRPAELPHGGRLRRPGRHHRRARRRLRAARPAWRALPPGLTPQCHVETKR